MAKVLSLYRPKGKESSSTSSLRKAPVREDETGCWVEAEGDLHFFPAGYPNLSRNERTKAWRVREGTKYVKYMSLGVIAQETAIRHYLDWEYDPEAFRKKWQNTKTRRRRTVISALEHWCVDARRRNLADKSVARRDYVARAIAQRWRTSRIGDLTAEGWAEWLEDWTCGLKTSSARVYYGQANSWVRWCAKRGWCEDFTFLVEPPQPDRYDPHADEPHKRILDREQLDRLFAELDPYWLPVAITQWTLGLRWKEARAVRANHLHDLETEHPKLWVPAGKTKKGRKIPIPDQDTIDVLLAIGRREYPHKYHRYLTELERACEKAHVPRITTHALRHMCATRWASEGVGLRDHMRWMGHSSVEMSEVYVSDDAGSAVLPRSHGIAAGVVDEHIL